MKLNNQEIIQKIIDLFNCDPEFKFWKIKTKLTSIIDNFFVNYIGIAMNKRKKYINVVSFENNKFKIMCNNIEVTPSKEKRGGASKSAIRQYLDILQAFKIIKKSLEFEDVYTIIDENFLNNDMSFESSNLIERIVENFENLDKQSKKIFYSVFITFLLSFDLKSNEELNIKVGIEYERMTVKAIEEYAKHCGYNFFQKSMRYFGYELEEIYKNLLKFFSDRN